MPLAVPLVVSGRAWRHTSASEGTSAVVTFITNEPFSEYPSTKTKYVPGSTTASMRDARSSPPSSSLHLISYSSSSESQTYLRT